MNAKITDINKRDWIDAALQDDKVIEDGLYEIGISKTSINKCLREFNQFKKDLNDEILIQKYYDNRYSGHREDGDKITETKLKDFKHRNQNYHRKSDGEYAIQYFERLSNRLKSLLGFLEFKIQNEEFIEIKIPIFKFNSPAIKGSKVKYENTNTKNIKNNYNISILGSGLGTTKSITLSFAHSFTSCDGANLLVFMPVRIKTSLVNVYNRGKFVKQILRSEWAINDDNRFIENIGCEEQRKDEFLEHVEPVEFQRFYHLSNSSEDSNPTFKKVLNSSQDLNFQCGIDMFDLNTTCKAIISRSKDIKLEYQLPPGHTYSEYTILNGQGIMWDLKKKDNPV